MSELYQSEAFPRLTSDNCRVTSPADSSYNCIAWAAGDVTRCWWPSGLGGHYWPDHTQGPPTPAAFERAFTRIGYRRCEDGSVEPGYVKVALYARPDGLITHAARQVGSKWTSKLGEVIDIIHSSADDVADGLYGEVVEYLRRRVS